ncbi:hypothetical protein N7462_004161 [Penicillium macrosclerotiorum]|uniref:uncharacterized protein n=1 Tax=Penicillium macrosclerotiorum TaxID=303699 RepID=UPI0025495E02|nr:uncharacterized protein N7462_004161 [Penicillium macrosclerotiorum]KAJ5689769.1 hypothetical protein N7462_004161 [Penicillium macrosclerotiorum]
MEQKFHKPEDGCFQARLADCGSIISGEKEVGFASLFPTTSDPFGDDGDAGVKYETMAWWQAGMIMIAETISLGILALPKALSILGLFLGILTILGVGVISTYTGYTIKQLKRCYMQIHSMADAGDLLMGKLGRRFLGLAQLLFYIVIGSHILTFSIMMNVLTEHSSCTLLYSSVGLLISFFLTRPSRLERPSRLSAMSFVSITAAVITSMIGASVSKGSTSHIFLFSSAPAVPDACLAIANFVFVYAGHVAFFTLFSELRDIKDFPKAQALLQITEMIFYSISAIVIYAYVGSALASPALNSAGKLSRKISYVIAILTAAWAVICITLWVVSWEIAEGIPIFNDILGLVTDICQSSLFATWFSFGLPGMFWLFLNRNRGFLSWRQMIPFGINVYLVLLGLIICVIGLYSPVRSNFYNLQKGVGEAVSRVPITHYSE